MEYNIAFSEVELRVILDAMYTIPIDKMVPNTRVIKKIQEVLDGINPEIEECQR